MATLSRITSKSGRAIHRGLLSSLPRGHKRSSPTNITSRSIIQTQQEQLSKDTASALSYPAVSSHHFCRAQLSACQGNLHPSIPSLAHYNTGHALHYTSRHDSHRYFSSFVDRMKKRAEETAKSVAKEASKRVQKTASKASESAQKAVSETLESTQRAAKQATNQAIQKVSETATNTARGVTEATSKKIQSTVDGAKQELSKAVSQSTTVQTISKSTRAIGSGIEETQKAASQTAKSVKESSQQLKETVTSTSSKVIRWFWWWSLAAIFVYGVASTLPMAIIKYTVEQKKEAFQARMKGSDDNSETTTTTATSKASQDAEPQA